MFLSSMTSMHLYKAQLSAQQSQNFLLTMTNQSATGKKKYRLPLEIQPKADGISIMQEGILFLQSQVLECTRSRHFRKRLAVFQLL